MAIIDYAPEFGTKFTLTGPSIDGVPQVATFNDPTDPNYVGVLSNITGLDSPEIAESGESLVEFDGGVAGPGFYGRRPIMMEGLVYGHGSQQERGAKLARLRRASELLRTDGVLSWTPTVTNGEAVYMKVRRQQPLRVEGSWNKTFALSLVASDPRVYASASDTLLTDPTTQVALNPIVEGDAETWPVYSLVGLLVAPVVTNYTSTGSTKLEFSLSLNTVDVLLIDTLNRTAVVAWKKQASRTNMITDPSLEGGTVGGWVANSGNTTLTNVTEAAGFQRYGTKVLQVTRTSTLPAAFGLTQTFTGLVAGEYFTFGFDYRTPGGLIGLPTLTFTFKTSADVTVGSIVTLSPTSPDYYTNTAWKRLIGHNLVPATATKVTVSVGYIPVNHAANLSVVNFDGFSAERSTTTATPGDFFSGATAPTDYSTAWTGTANASTSTATLTNPTAVNTRIGPQQDAYQYLNFATSSWSPLKPGTNNLILSADTKGAGSSFRVDWRNAWL